MPKEEKIFISFITDVPNPDMLGHRLVFREKRIEKNDRFFDANLKSFDISMFSFGMIFVLLLSIRSMAHTYYVRNAEHKQ